MSENKVVYLTREDGKGIKGYVVDYLLDTETNNTYLIIVDQNGKNAKAFEIKDEKAIILSAKEVGMFASYNLNPRFVRVTSGYENEKLFTLARREQMAISVESKEKLEDQKPVEEVTKNKMEQEIPVEDSSSVSEETKEGEVEEETKEKEIFFYVYDGDDIKKYSGILKSGNEETLEVSHVHYLFRISDAKNLNIEEFMDSEAVELGAYFVDLDNYERHVEQEKGQMVAEATLHHALCKTKKIVEENKEAAIIEKPKMEPLEDSKKIIFYVYNSSEIIKYSGILIGQEEKYLDVTNVKLLERIQEEVHDIEKLMKQDNFEVGAYFVNSKDYKSSVKKENGKSVASAKLYHVSCKDKEQTSLFSASAETEVLNHHPDKDIVFYVQDHGVIKKYKGTLKKVSGEQLGVKNFKFLETIEEQNEIEEQQFLEEERFEVDSYFINYNNFISKVKEEKGELINVAILSHPFYKQMNKAKSEKKEALAEMKKENIANHQIIAFEGEIDTHEGKTKYTVYGTVCTVLEEDPFTIQPENNGEKSIIYTDESAHSIEEVCQIYQNLYPARSVYLLNGYEITSGKQHILKDNEYQKFIAQNNLESNSLLEHGKRILTEKEMVDARKIELQNLKKKSKSEKKKKEISIAEEYLKSCPEDIQFASYLHSLENAGVTKEHMMATGLLKDIQNKMEDNKSKTIETQFKMNGTGSSNLKWSTFISTISPSMVDYYKKIFNNIRILEQNSKSAVQIYNELDLENSLPSIVIKQIKDHMKSQSLTNLFQEYVPMENHNYQKLIEDIIALENKNLSLEQIESDLELSTKFPPKIFDYFVQQMNIGTSFKKK